MDKQKVLEAVQSMDVDALESAHVELQEATAGNGGIVLVIINEQHTLMDDQQRAILNDFCPDGMIATVKIPADGLSRQEIKTISEQLAKTRCHVVFASPIPYMILLLASKGKNLVGVLHNDHREKKELPNGKVISTVAPKGWKCLTH